MAPAKAFLIYKTVIGALAAGTQYHTAMGHQHPKLLPFMMGTFVLGIVGEAGYNLWNKRHSNPQPT